VNRTTHRRDPALLPELAQRDAQDAQLLRQVQRVYDRNLRGSTAPDKVWRQRRREGTAVARCTVKRLMRLRGLRGARRGRIDETPSRS
jgi:putative transposase